MWLMFPVWVFSNGNLSGVVTGLFHYPCFNVGKCGTRIVERVLCSLTLAFCTIYSFIIVFFKNKLNVDQD